MQSDLCDYCVKPIVATSVERYAVMANRNAYFPQFFYRVNPDKTIDAICGFCFAASPSADNQADLRIWETAHCCLGRLKQSA